ncbi:hypothetical protein K491DRAFT_715745 [Lophiostoma macrostomum CBS 122681]|uniref:TLC domain-containing protein n=1 Tax=Lophiostoma macrostomum CBS 122681 TaxID=1314788 RepID=A0A6A6T8S1_9PLEO|nr:hypothetical protein K491DRAFT_715745 [Lophiostoma macrostomum CBS 122681]
MTHTPFTPYEGPLQGHSILSSFAQYSGLVLVICLVIVFLIRSYVFEKWYMPRYFKDKYYCLDDHQRRGLVNHCVSILLKAVMFAWTVYPFCKVKFSKATFATPLCRGGTFTLGDAMLFSSQMFIAMYLHELLYRAELSMVALAHHIGTVVIAQFAVALTLMESEREDAAPEFMLCMLWGIWDGVSEGYVHGVIIVKRKYPDNHRKIRNWNRFACYSTAFGTLIETVLIMWLFSIHWNRWNLGLKIATPVLHTMFSAAQLWGTKNYYSMWKYHEDILNEDKKKTDVGEREKGYGVGVRVDSTPL